MKYGLLFTLLFFSVLLISPYSYAATELSEKVSGKILLQVEFHGEAWYVNPVDRKRYYLGRSADAFQIMRELGLGVSSRDFDSYKGKAPQRLAGRVLLKVQDYGKAYYVNPDDLKMHYLGSPNDAFNVIRKLGIGIKDSLLTTIAQANRPAEKKVLGEKVEIKSNEKVRLEAPKTNENLIQCNNKYWSPCNDGTIFYCPPWGDAQCIVNGNKLGQQNYSQNTRIENEEGARRLLQQEQERKLREEQEAREKERERELVRQDELRRQRELEETRQAYEGKIQELENLVSSINQFNSQKNVREQELFSQESDYISTYCEQREQEINDNYASRGLYFSGMRRKAIEDLKITCPTEARNLYRAYQNEVLYPLVVQQENMKRQFQQYNQRLYSDCTQYKFANCSIYVDAALPVR